ncbi:MAG: ABC transporter ATP-binding protein [Chitinophagaceae bacterium]|nr:ABC transporter ATP-binding protein [Chitinophagaceae bacterium]
MNLSFHHRLQQVQDYFTQGDHHLGYRRLLDATLETENLELFEDALHFAEFYEQNPSDSNLPTHLGNLLRKLENANISVVTNNNTPKIITEQISKKYASGNFGLSGVTLNVKPGEIIGLVGENGNGKTTLLRLLYGDLLPDTGKLTYHFEGKPAKSDAYSLRSRLAFVPQRHSVWYGGLMENLQFTAAHYGMKGNANRLWTEMIVARMGLRQFRSYSWNRISSGYKMRFELARTLLRRPEVMLLDEPLANLDVLAQQIILEDLLYLSESLSHPMAVVLSSQQLYEVEKVSEKVVFLKNGVPQIQSKKERDSTSKVETGLIIELESTATRNEITAAIQVLQPTQISYNGGVYLLYFSSVSFGEVMQALAQSGLPIRYIRDISQSSRRFFDN